ncbi:MAG: acetyl-CoA carboxylase carboxyltransferase subunit beta [Candidatus Hydrogenedentes bacterium]|nr:acetyl-CoA carboxylase carboxyltransferase subunit beta [Candidatus Hydrogenedentota bacterium]
MAFLKRRRFISVIGRKSAVPPGVWMKCAGCNQPVIRTEVGANQWVCPRCNYHLRITARRRIQYLVDPDSFQETHGTIVSADPLGFSVDEVNYSYRERVKKAKEKTGLNEAMITGFGRIESTRTVLALMDFSFRGGSMGSAVGEKFCRAVDDAVRERLPVVLFAASGGARMEEGLLSLVQMAKTADAVRRINEARLPYIAVLTDPTTGGVYASFASLADIILAEPGAHIGFAGPRLIESALKVELPEGFQSAEYQFRNGFVDRIVNRTELRPLLGKLLRYLSTP